MKRLFLSAAMAVFSLCTFAQSAVGSVTLQPKVGLNIASKRSHHRIPCQPHR